MTAIVGILCKDGVVIGCDSARTVDGIVEQPAEKLKIIGDSLIVVGTGDVGYIHRHLNTISIMWENGLFQPKENESYFDVANKISYFSLSEFYKSNFHVMTQQAQTIVNNFNIGSLIAFPYRDSFYLCQIQSGTIQPLIYDSSYWYCSMGSGCLITDPFLGFIREVFWTDRKLPTLAEGIFCVNWALSMAIKINTGGVNGPIHIATLTKSSSGFIAKELSEDELKEHDDNIEEAKNALRYWRKKFTESENTPVLPKFP